MCCQAHRKGIVFSAQPARAGGFHRHQIRDSLRAIVLQPGLFISCNRLQVTRDLMIVRSNDNKTFALRALLEFEDTLNGLAIVRITTQTVAGLGGIGDDATAPEVGGEATRRND